VTKAQDTLHFNFNNNFRMVEDSTAPNLGIAIKQDTLWNLLIVEIASGKLLMNGFYNKDFTGQVGKCEYFYTNGQRRSSGYFHNGVEAGEWDTWDSSGRIMDSTFFVSGSPKFSYKFEYYPDGILKETSFSDGVSAKSATKSFYEDGSLRSLGEFTNKSGTIKYFYENGQLSQLTEFNKAGKVTRNVHYTEEGKEITEKELAKQREALIPEFPGGQSSLQSYLLRNLVLTEAGPSSDTYRMELKISFYLNAQGRPYDIKITNAPNPTLENSAIRILQHMDSWNMKGQKVWGPVTMILILKN
jgi:antitoxin component YwqK of YwqJK toxin-antitoxin module